MIKRTMYFYDKKQADLIKKVNDKLHRQRGVRVGDDSQMSEFLAAIPDIKKSVSNIKKYANLFTNSMTKSGVHPTILNMVKEIQQLADRAATISNSLKKPEQYHQIGQILYKINNKIDYFLEPGAMPNSIRKYAKEVAEWTDSTIGTYF